MRFIDYDRQVALVADYHHPHTDEHEIIGVGSFIKEPNVKSAEIVLLVTDQFQRKGLGTELLRCLIQVGRDVPQTSDPSSVKAKCRRASEKGMKMREKPAERRSR